MMHNNKDGEHHGLFERRKEAVAAEKAKVHSKVVSDFANIVVEMMDEGQSKAMAMDGAYVPIELKAAVSVEVDAILAERDADRYP
jgi:hypothetical protein